MAITGAHVVLYTSEPEKVRAIFRDVFDWKHLDVGDGWLIFRLPPAELGVHPAEGPTHEAGARHLFTLMCDDVTRTTAELKSKGIAIPAGLSPAARGASVDPVRVLRAG